MNAWPEFAFATPGGKGNYKLKSGIGKEVCNTCNDLIDKSSDFFLEIEQGGIYLQSRNPKLMLELLNDDDDGFAIELIGTRSYSCGNEEYYTAPSRRNGQSLFNGKLLKPVYQEELIKSLGLEEIDSYNKVKILYETGGWPEGRNWRLPLGNIYGKESLTTANLVVIQDGKVCRIMHLSKVCNDEDAAIELPEIKPEALLDILPSEFDKTLVPEYIEKRETFVIPFEKGRFNYRFEDIKPLMDTLTFDNFEIQSIDVQAFSSLEGSEKVNQELSLKRAGSIANAIKSAQQGEVYANVQAQPNWDLFKVQIIKYDDLKDLRGLSREEIKIKLRDRAYVQKIEPYLQAQRRAEVTIEIRADLVGKNLEKYVKLRLKIVNRQMLELLNGDGVGLRKILAKREEVEQLQYAAYRFIKQGKMSTSIMDGISFPERKLFDRLEHNRLWTKVRFEEDKWNDLQALIPTFKKMQRLAFASDADPIWKFNYLVLYTRYTRDRLPDWVERPEKAAALLNFNVRFRVPKSKSDHLKLHFYNQFLPYFNDNNWDEERLEGIKFMRQYYKRQKEMDAEEKYQVAKMFAQYQQYKDALKLLDPIIKSGKSSIEARLLYARLAYVHVAEQPDSPYFDWLISQSKALPSFAWCELFGDKCGIPIQILDHERLRDVYCETCSGSNP